MSGGSRSSAPRKFRLVRLALALATFLPAMLALNETQPAWLDRAAYDFISRDILPRASQTDQIVFVDIDDGSLQELNQRWPIPRLMWAQLVRRLSQFQPAAIALDAFFPEPSAKAEVELALTVADQLREDGLDATPEGNALAGDLERQAAERDADRQFAKAIAEAGNVVLGIADGGHTAGALAAGELAQLPVIPGIASDAAARLAYVTPRGSIPELTMSARSQAGLHVPYSVDGVMRRYGYIARAGETNVASLALAAVQVAYPDRAEELGRNAMQVDGGLPLLRWIDISRVPRVRLSDVLDAEADNPALLAAMRGRIIFVGVSAVGAADRRQTPLRSDLPGTYVHIVAAFNLLSGELVGSEGVIPRTLTWIAAALALLAFLGWRRVTSASVLVFSAIGIMAAWGASGLVGIHQGWLVPVTPVLLGVLLPMGGELVLRANSAEQARKQIRDAFHHYLSPAVVEELVNDPAKLQLGGSRREITAFFSDIAGFTTISERLDPADLTRLLNEYLGAMTEIILDEGGTVDKYIGDAVVAMFGAPLDQADHALHACRAAVRCRARLAELRPQWVQRGWPEVHARIGVNSGVALVGNMGSAARFDYTMLGDTVNLAARLEGANKAYGTEIMVGETTAAAVGEGMPLRELDRVRVKGKLQGISIYEVLGDISGADERTLQIARDYGAGLRAWREQSWDRAREAFGRAAAQDDKPAKVFLSRLETIVAHALPADWDGVFEMTEK